MNPEQNQNQNLSPLGADEAELDSALRALADTTHPRAEFTAALCSEIEQKQALKAARKQPFFRRPLWALLALARPWMAQAGLVLLLAALLALAGRLAPQPAQPSLPAAPSLMPGQPGTINSSLPPGALARLGRGMILALDSAADGRTAVGSTASLCVYDTGMQAVWCDWTPQQVIGALFDPSGQYLAVTLSPRTVQVRSAADGHILAQREFVSTREPTMEELLSSFAFTSFGPAIAWDPSSSQRLAAAGIGGALSAWNWQDDSLAWEPLALEQDIASLSWAQITQNRTVMAAADRAGLVIIDPNSGEVLRRLPKPDGETAQYALLASALSPDGQKLAVVTPGGVNEMRLNAGGMEVGGPHFYPTAFEGIRMLYSRDSSRLAVLSNQSIYIFSSEEETEIYPAHPFSPLAWSADGSLFYALPEGALGKITDGESWFVNGEYTSSAQYLAWSSPNEITGAGGGSIFTWDAASGLLNVSSRQLMEEGYFPLAGLSADGKRAVYFQSTGTQVLVWDTARNQVETRLDTQESQGRAEISAAGISEDGRWVYAVTRGGTVFAWDGNEGWQQRAVQILPEDAQIDALAWQPGGTRLAAGWTSKSGPQIDLWDMTTGETTASAASQETISDLAFSPDGQRLGAVHGRISLWDASTLQRLHTLGPEMLPGADGALESTPGSFFTALAFSPDGQTLAAGGEGVSLWSLETGLPVGGFRGHAASIFALAYRPDGQVLASSSMDGTIIVWDLGASSLGSPDEPQPTATPLAEASSLPNMEPVSLDGPLPLGLAVSAYRLDRPVMAEEMGFEQARAALGPGSRLARLPEGRSLWDSAVLAEMDSVNAGLGPFGYRLESKPVSGWDSRWFQLWQGETMLLDDITGFYPISVAPDGSDFRLLVEGTSVLHRQLVHKDGVEPYTEQDGGITGVSRPQYLGSDLVHATYSTQLSGEPGVGTVQLWRGGQEFYRLQVQETGVMLPVMGFWTYGEHWALETAGSVGIDGMSANKQYGYDESFAFQLLDGRPLFFFRRGESLGIHFDGQEVALPWEEIPHYNCCSAGLLNPMRVGNVLLILARQGEQWFYAEIEGRQAAEPDPLGGLEAYELTAYTFDSPDGQWQAESLRGEVTESSPAERDYNRITLFTDGTARWVYEEWTPHGLGEGFYAGFTWSPDSQYLYFYQSAVPDGCGVAPLNSHLRRFSTVTGQVESVAPFAAEQYGNFSLSPGADRLAVVLDGTVEIHPLDGGESGPVKIPFLPSDAPEAQAGTTAAPVWSPDGSALYFDWVSPYPACGDPREAYTVYLVDTAAYQARPLDLPDGYTIAADGWTRENRLRVNGPDGTMYWLSPQDGKLEPMPPDETQEALTALAKFLNLLADGEKDRNGYWQAARLFGGNWSALAAQIPGGSLDDKPALLRQACMRAIYPCYRTSAIQPVGLDEALSLHFAVRFIDNQGRPVNLDGKSTFDYAVTRTAEGEWIVKP
jgi:WD40 repeat protein